MEEFQDRLIRCVQDYKVLYDPTFSKDLPNAEIKTFVTNAWEAVAENLNLPVNVCKTVWLNLRQDFKKALCNQRYIRIPGKKTLTLCNFKFDKQMGFLVPFLGNIPSPMEITFSNYINPARNSSNLCKSINPSDKKTEETENNNNEIIRPNSVVDEGEKVVEKPFEEEEDGELIVKLWNETVAIPTTFISENSARKSDDIVINIHQKTGFTISEKKCTIPVTVKCDSEQSEKKQHYKQIDNNDVNLKKDSELNLHHAQKNKEILVSKELEPPRKKLCITKPTTIDDSEGEEYFYGVIAATANRISSYVERLKLRKEVSRFVFDAAQKYIENHSENS